MHTSTFFRLFPPPKFLTMKHAGLDISDDAIHCIEYAPSRKGMRISMNAEVELPAGLFDGGDVKNEKAFTDLISAFDRQHHLSYVKVSLPEEKAYLFQTDVPAGDMQSIEQNIEFKLEENVPLSAADAVFYFDLLPAAPDAETLRASVSVVPRTYIEHYISLLRGAGVFPVAFEIAPKSIARAIASKEESHTTLIVHIMNGKTGLYIIVGQVVCFASTIAVGSAVAAATADAGQAYVRDLSREINKVYSYWVSHRASHSAIDSIVLVGRGAASFEGPLQNVVVGATVPLSTAHVWQNIFDTDVYVPPISRDNSFEYAVAAGLAMPL